ncbi:MAG: hypothetical protein GTO46_10380 [Gemmatimonadetes bacterium]|nr:hypothetical protein [Gemmatimonadota bacterium]NIO32019.1 hypothetical protein [Gemmatimonadota bacterium]
MNRFERWTLWLSAALSALTGIGLLWTKYFIQSDTEWAVINHPLQPVFLKAHILTTPVLAFALGLIATRHIWKHYRAGITRGRKSGIVAMLATVPMVLTGYLIQVVTHLGFLRLLAVAHIALGLLFTVKLILHQAIVRRAPGEVVVSREGSAGSGRRGKVRGQPAVASGD